MNTKRIFIAIPASVSLIERVKNWKNGFDIGLNNRWVLEENLHVTLVPPIQASEQEISEIKKKLGNIKSSPFKIIFNKLEVRPNILWAAGDAALEIKNFKSVIYRALKLPLEDRTFLPHMTLARLKDLSRIKILKPTINWPMEVKEFVLYESQLLPEGAKYFKLGIFNLMTGEQNSLATL